MNALVVPPNLRRKLIQHGTYRQLDTVGLKHSRASLPSSRKAMLASAAESYARLGWAVLPLHGVRKGVCTCSRGTACPSPGKHPLLEGGVNMATDVVAEVHKLWAANPDANVGIATGRRSGLLALDVDPRNGGKETSRRLCGELGRVPRTVVSDTGGGGYHRLFRYPPEGCPTRHLKTLPGLDVQSDGAYIVAPPSRHASGKRYAWREDRAPTSVSLAELPRGWLERVKREEKAVPATAMNESAGVICEGGRNSHLTSRAGSLRHAGLSAPELLAALQAANLQDCSPPLDEKEVARIAENVSRYPAAAAGDDDAERIMQLVLDQHYAGGEHLIVPSDGRFWSYDGTRWIALGGKVLDGVILATIQAMPTRPRQHTASLMSQVARLIEARVATSGDPLRFLGEPQPVINCLNGELWIGTDGTVTLRPHNPRSYLRQRLDVHYDPAAKAPRYDEAVRGIFGKASDIDALCRFWEELMGYAMQPDRRMALILLGWGTGNNGKTKLLETFIRLVGQELIAAMPIGDIDKSRFSMGGLLGKLALVDDDVKSGTRLPDGPLKRLSENKTVTGELKFKPAFTFQSRTMVVMLFNNPPSIADLSHGLQRRLTVVPFDRVFTPEETDAGLFQRIWAEEMAGVLNRYLEGLRRFVQRGWKLAPPPDVVGATAKLLLAANPVPAFIAQRCERAGSALVNDLYHAYKAWAEGAGITYAQQRMVFGRNLESLSFKVAHSNKGDKVYGLRLTQLQRD